MAISVEHTSIPDLVRVTPQRLNDLRGSFTELFKASDWSGQGIEFPMRQINQSVSQTGVIRGLHLQYDRPMAKAMRVVAGRAFLVAVDVRLGSPTRGQWWGDVFTPDPLTHLVAPAGFARGLCALENNTVVQYLCSAEYNPAGEAAICWNDPDLGITWPVDQPILSDKDLQAPLWADWSICDAARHFVYP